MSESFVFLEGTDRQAHVEARRLAFAPSRPPAAYHSVVTQLMDSPFGRRAWRVPALLDGGGALLASMDLYDTAVRLGSRRLRLGGIGCLSVRPDLRGQGLGRRLVEEVHARMAGEGLDGTLLFSSVGPAYYERLGYETLPMLRLQANLQEWRRALPGPPTPSVIRPYAGPDFEDVRNLFNTTAALQEMAILRDAEYWQVELLRVRLRDELLRRTPNAWTFAVGRREGRVVSYMRTDWEERDGLLTVLELGFEAGCREDVTALILAVLQRLDPRGPVRLCGVVPSRLENLVPTRRLRWIEETEHVLMMRSFGSFTVPSRLPQDARLIWQGDWF
jgi:GNAT superfamily N-acetyltransferase